MTAIQGIASQRGKSRALQLALKTAIVIAFGMALVALARGPVEVGSNVLAPSAQTAQSNAKASPQEPAQAGSTERTRYFPAEFPDVRGEIQPTPDTF